MIQVADENRLQVGDQYWPGRYYRESMADHPGIEVISSKLGYDYVFERRQFIVKFESGWRVSIIWGSMSYSDNHDHAFGRSYADFVETPETVEAAVFHANREGIQGNDGDPFAYIDAEYLNTLLSVVSNLGTEDHMATGPE